MFLEEPAGGEGTVFVPVNSSTTFRCSVAEGYTFFWQVQLPHTSIVLPPTALPSQFELTEISSTSSMLSIHDVTKDLNGTRVLCVATILLNPEASEVLVIVYGKCTAQGVIIIVMQ